MASRWLSACKTREVGSQRNNKIAKLSACPASSDYVRDEERMDEERESTCTARDICTLVNGNVGKTKSLAQCRSFQISCNYKVAESREKERERERERKGGRERLARSSTEGREVGSIAFSEFLFPVVASSSNVSSFALKLHVPR